MEPLPDLIDRAITILLRADGDRDHMNHSDITCEQSMGIVEILRMCKASTLRGSVKNISDDALFNIATEAWSTQTDSSWSSDGLEAAILAVRSAVEDAPALLASPPEQPQYLANCLRAGSCTSTCQSTACTNYGKAIVARRCVEPKQDGIVYPGVDS